MNATTASPAPRRSPRALVRAVALVALPALLSACSHLFAKPPADLDYSRSRISEGGHFRATIKPQNDTIVTGRLHSWTLHLETADGRPVETAAVQVDGGMPQHGHGLPTKPRVTRALGQGSHLVEGMKFNMGGWWIVKFRINAASIADSLVFNLKL